MHLAGRLSRWTLGGIALCVYGLVVIRAKLQSITVDEADSFMAFAAQQNPFQWYPSSANHVLNSIVMRFFFLHFGVSHLTLRSSALIGAALFITASYFVCRIVTARFALRAALLICLIANPLILDYLIAARGYSLALGFLMVVVCCCLYAILDENLDQKSVNVLVVVASVSAALSLSANFSFAFVDASALAFLLVTLLQARRSDRLSLASAAVLPGALTVLLISGWTILSFPKSQLYYGAHTVGEMWRSLQVSSLFGPNREMLNPMMFSVADRVQRILPWLFYAAALALAVGTIRSRAKPIRTIAVYFALVLSATFVLHLLMHKFFKILLPMDRTGTFFVVLATLLVATMVELQTSRAMRMAGLATLALGAFYYLGCLRTSYFKEWEWDDDTEGIHYVVRSIAQRTEIRDVAPSWMYLGALRFYALRDKQNDLHFFDLKETGIPQRVIYVLNGDADAAFIEQHGLKVEYRMPSNAVICVAQPRS